MADARNRLLPAVAVALAVVKFGLLPWVGAQADARQRLQVLTQRLDRSVGVVQNRDAILKVASGLESSVGEARKRFPQSESAAAFRLETQQLVSSMVSAQSMTVGLFEWILEGSAADARLKFVRMRVQVTGGLRRLATLQGEWEGGMPHLVVRDVQINSANAIGRADDSPATMVLVGDLYFRDKSADAGGRP